MSDIISVLREKAVAQNEKIIFFPISRVSDLQRESIEFMNSNTLSEYHQTIMSRHYSFEYPQEMQSIIFIAVTSPAYAEVVFQYKQKEYRVYTAIFNLRHTTRAYIDEIHAAYGEHYEEVSRLPMKRMAARSGLAVYGRNNITYVEGFGSAVSYIAFYSSIPVSQGPWEEIKRGALCDNCKVCLTKCPTDAIIADRHLIDTDRCLGRMNTEGKFAEWVPDEAHHTIFYCLKCQVHCPMNRGSYNFYGTVSFDEAETERILKGMPFDDVDEATKAKIDLLWLERSPAVEGNIKRLFDLIDKGHKIVL